MALGVVQFASNTTSGANVNATATFASAPTAGNYVVAIYVQGTTSAAPASLSSGWSSLNPWWSGGVSGSMALIRKVQSGDGASVTPCKSSANASSGILFAWEVSSTDGPPMMTHRDRQSGSQTTTPSVSIANFVPSKSGGLALMMSYVTNINSAAPAAASGFSQAGSLITLSGARGIAFHQSNVSASSGYGAFTTTWGTGSSAIASDHIVVLEPSPTDGVYLAQNVAIVTPFTAGNITATLAGAPTVGNRLVAMAVVGGSSQAFTAAAGWTLVGSNTSQDGLAHRSIFVRDVQVGDTASVTPCSTNTSSTGYMYVFEITKQNSSAALNSVFNHAAAANPPSVSVTNFTPSRAGTIALIVANVDNTGTPRETEMTGFAIVGVCNIGSGSFTTVAYVQTDVSTVSGVGPTIVFSTGTSAASNSMMAVYATAGGAVVVRRRNLEEEWFML